MIEIETLKAAVEAARALLDAMETCHVCQCVVSLEDGLPIHCENCSWDCDEHEEPACTPIYVLHQRARSAIGAVVWEPLSPDMRRRGYR
jgi:hypothetical protein